MMTLVKYEAARRALAVAKSSDEVRHIRDVAEAMRAYAKQAKDRQLEIDAAEIRIRAERRLGERIAAQKEGVGLNRGAAGGGTKQGPRGAYVEPRDTAPTLSEAGIDKKLSSRAQQLAALPDDEFDDLLGTWRGRLGDNGERVTVQLLREREQTARDAALGTPEPITGRYRTVVIDPPWPMRKIERDVRPNQHGFDYPTLSEAELAALTLPTMADAHLFLWTTQKFLPMALRLLDAWDARYVCTFVWHKPGGFQPVGLPQYNCEFALYARRGSPQFLDTTALPTCFTAPRREHSRKPDAFYDVVRRVTAGPRVDLFSRTRGERGLDRSLSPYIPMTTLSWPPSRCPPWRMRIFFSGRPRSSCRWRCGCLTPGTRATSARSSGTSRAGSSRLACRNTTASSRCMPGADRRSFSTRRRYRPASPHRGASTRASPMPSTTSSGGSRRGRVSTCSVALEVREVWTGHFRLIFP